MTKLISALLVAASLAAENPYHVLNRFPVPGDGGFDYATIDSAARRLYLSHGTEVNVIDPDTGKSVGVIPDTPGVHGIVIASEFKHGFTTNGRENKVSMFNPTDLSLIKKIDVGKGPDGIYYDAATKRVFTCNHGSDDMTVIDAATGDVVGAVKLDGGGEAMLAAKDGLIYVNVEDKGEVAAFDPKTLDVKHRYSIGIAKTPTGLAYDPKTNRLFIGCRQPPTMVVMDAGNGRVVAHFPIGAGVDWASWDATNKIAFASCGDGTLATFHQKSANEYEDMGAVKTEPGAKTMAFDVNTGRLFLPTADMEQAPGGNGQRSRMRPKPGTFHVIVVGKK